MTFGAQNPGGRKPGGCPAVPGFRQPDAAVEPYYGCSGLCLLVLFFTSAHSGIKTRLGG